MRTKTIAKKKKFSAEIEGTEPTPDRREQRKSEMEALNTPDITSKLMLGDKEFLKTYIDEGKSLEEIAKEFGEDIEDKQKTEMRVYAKMQEIGPIMKQCSPPMKTSGLVRPKGPPRDSSTGVNKR